MSDSDHKAPVNFVDDPHAPEIFASGITGYFRNEGNVSITFESARVDYTNTPGPVNRVVVHRVVLPLATARTLVSSLDKFLKDQTLSSSEGAEGKHSSG